MSKINIRAEATRQADENMLKVIRLLHLQKGYAHVSDLADELGMNLATTYSSVTKLAEKGYLLPLERRGGRKSNKQSITFSPKGVALAKKILERHDTIQAWLIRLGVSPNEADEEACHIEHAITDTTMDIIKSHVAMASSYLGTDALATDVIHEKTRQIENQVDISGMTATEKMEYTLGLLFGPEAAVCTMPDGDEVNFYQLMPLYDNEMNYKRNSGAEALENLFPDDFDMVLDINRPNVLSGKE